MTQFVLTPEQASFLSASEGKVAVYSPDGAIAGLLSPIRPGFGAIPPDQCPSTAEEIAAAEKEAASCTEWHTTEEVLSRLHGLRQP
jgi:hypothetical protein